MKETTLTPGEISRARGKFYIFAIFNVISFSLLSGNIITLYALRLGASSFLIGLLSSFMYSAYLCMLIGRMLVPRLGMVKLMGRFWLIRYLMMLPVLLSPFFASRGLPLLALSLITLSVLGFNVARGIAITGYNPIVGEMASEKDRGAFLARVQAIQNLVLLALGIAMAFILGPAAPLYIYILFVIFGITTGIIAASIIFSLPEPGVVRRSLSENLWAGFLRSLKQGPFKKFIIIHFLTSLAIFMITPFLIVYIKNIYHQGDSTIILFTVVGSLGALTMALASGFMIDKLGAKPLYFIYAGILTLTVIPMILSPGGMSGKAIWIFASAIFFFHSMGHFGILNAGQTYFLTAIKPEERLNLGVIFYLTQGLAGGIGSTLGGAVLQALQGLYPAGEADVFRIYFGSIACLFIIILFLINNMASIGAYSIKDTLSVIFSPRDIRAISLLHRLSKSRSISEEKGAIRAIADSHSGLSIHEILSKLRSPRFTIRAEALAALEKLPTDSNVTRALISEVKNHSFTTAYLAADVLGKKQIFEARKILRKSLRSEDYFLSGKCMVSLARLNDRESIAAVEDIILNTSNPRLIIHGAVALEIYKKPESISLLLTKMEKKISPYIRDEIILSVAGIMGMGEWFYPCYTAFLEKSNTGISMLNDITASGKASVETREMIRKLLELLPRNRKNFVISAGKLLKSLELREDSKSIPSILIKALTNTQLIPLDRFCFLVAAAIVKYYHL